MRLFIAANRQLAHAILDAMPSIRQGADDYDVVVHCDGGRPLELQEPAFYDERWGKWDAATLPIRVPYEKWRLTLRRHPEAKKQLEAIADLLKKTSFLVTVASPNSEGSFLIDQVIEHFGYRGPVMRLVLNPEDLASIEKIDSSILDNAAWPNAYQAELCRSRAGWLIGNNMSRAVTKLLARDQLIRIGRIQTPLLALVVRHCIEAEKKAASLRTYHTARTLLAEMRLSARCGAHDINALELQGFIKIDDKTGEIKDTAFGRSLVLALPEQLTDLSVAAAWEKALDQVTSGECSPEEFMRRIDIYVAKRLEEIKALSGKVTVQRTPATQSRQKTRSAQRARTEDKSTASAKDRHASKPCH